MQGKTHVSEHASRWLMRMLIPAWKLSEM